MSALAAAPVAPAAAAGSIRVREATPDDRAGIYDILMTSQIFGQSDAECVDEMFTETWAKPRADGYRWLCCVDESGRNLGFTCYGVESLTQDTWDLFWICVRPEARGRGVGRALMEETVLRAQRDNGRVMVIYTSSTAHYAPARKLYTGAGFAHIATVPDYYSDGDSLHIYWRRLGSR